MRYDFQRQNLRDSDADFCMKPGTRAQMRSGALTREVGGQK